jgi:hypothetical protein
MWCYACYLSSGAHVMPARCINSYTSIRRHSGQPLQQVRFCQSHQLGSIKHSLLTIIQVWQVQAFIQ